MNGLSVNGRESADTVSGHRHVGERRGMLTVVRDGGLSEYNKPQLIVECSSCGQEFPVLTSNWERGSTKFCRCRACLRLGCHAEREGEEYFCAHHLRELRANPKGPWAGLSTDFGVPSRCAEVALATGRRYTRREHTELKGGASGVAQGPRGERLLALLLHRAAAHGVPAERAELLRRRLIREADDEDVAFEVIRRGHASDAESEVLLKRLPNVIDELIASSEGVKL
jgi:hypothetical protein